MSQNKSTMDFRELLDLCSAPESPRWEAGWREFIKRYKMFIYGKVAKRSSGYNAPRLRMQFSEAVNDIVSNVYIKLCANQCQALRSFRERDNEIVFRSWLAIICSRITSRYMHKNFAMIFVEEEIEEVRDYVASLDFDRRWELYEAVVELLRGSFKHRKRLLERNIHILQLYIWAEFPATMILLHPCLKHIGPRVVDNLVSRLRLELRRHKNSFETS